MANTGRLFHTTSLPGARKRFPSQSGYCGHGQAALHGECESLASLAHSCY